MPPFESDERIVSTVLNRSGAPVNVITTSDGPRWVCTGCTEKHFVGSESKIREGAQKHAADCSHQPPSNG